MSSTPDPLVSVVIPTRNRATLLREAIEGVWNQTLSMDKIEIIVVDNRSTDETAAMIEELQNQSPTSLRFHVMQVNRGPAPSRNQGIRMARAEFVAFTDSDCRPAPGWLENSLAAFDDQTGLVTGQVLNKPEQRSQFFTRNAIEVKCENPIYPTANAVYRRNVLLELGGMDESLCFSDIRGQATECADTDLAWRVKARGWKSVFTSHSVVYHEIEKQGFLDWAAQPFRMFVIPALMKRHKSLRFQLLHWNIFLLRENGYFLLGLVGLLLGVSNFWWLLLTLPYVAWLVWVLVPNFQLANVPKLIPQAVLITLRQAFIMTALIYGSIRFRFLVL